MPPFHSGILNPQQFGSFGFMAEVSSGKGLGFHGSYCSDVDIFGPGRRGCWLGMNIYIGSGFLV